MPSVDRRVLLLDGAQRSALAATRALGRAGLAVVVGESAPRPLAGASRFAEGTVLHPSPVEHPERFVAWFEDQARSGRFLWALPMTEVTTDLLLRHRDRWPEVEIPFAPIETVDALSDKVRLVRQAKELGIPVPESIVVEGEADLREAVARIGFPAILKPRRSRLRTPTRFRDTQVRRVRDAAAVEALRTLPEFSLEPFLYQRLVPGTGAGVFALYDRGRPLAFFAHRRLREKPPEGGVSVLSESVAPDPELLGHARKLLDSVSWHGVAMVEFRQSAEAGAYLMEVNARFWGSLQLAIDAGVDFPRLLLEGGAALADNASSDYRVGQRLRWFLGDLDRLWLAFKQRGATPQRPFLHELLAFATPHARTRHEVFRWNDPAPALRELRSWIGALGR